MRRSSLRKETVSRKMRVESLEGRSLMAGDCFHNFTIPEDADASGGVTPLDALVVINRINQTNVGNPTNRSSNTTTTMVDVDADGALTPLDALVVINTLNSQSSVNATGMRASRVDSESRITRIEQAIASNSLPPEFSMDDARAILETLRAGGRPELGDYVREGSLRWHREDRPSIDNPVVDDPQSEQQQLQRFSEALARRLEAFKVSAEVIQNVSREMLLAYQAGNPLSFAQIRERLTQLGVEADEILPDTKAPPGFMRPDNPGHPPERPDQPDPHDDVIAPAVMVTEPVAESFIARLVDASVPEDIIEIISTEIWDAIHAGKPMDMLQVQIRLRRLLR